MNSFSLPNEFIFDHEIAGSAVGEQKTLCRRGMTRRPGQHPAVSGVLLRVGRLCCFFRWCLLVLFSVAPRLKGSPKIA
jgi:hypothetical protein